MLVLSGVALLLAGSRAVVVGSLAIAHRFRWPDWMTGLLVLAVGTSLPELFVSGAAAPSHPDLAWGNIFGSNIINLGLALGLVAVLRPIAARWRDMATSYPLLLLGALGVPTLLLSPNYAPGSMLAVLGGSCCLLLFAYSMVKSIRAGLAARVEEELEAGALSMLPAVLLTLGGFAGLAYGADLFLRGASGIALRFGIHEGLVGYIIAAFATSAPEVFTSLTALRHGRSGLALGNVLGSNLFNLLMVGGVVLLRQELPFDSNLLRSQFLVHGAFTLFLLAPILLGRLRRVSAPEFGRPWGLIAVLGYAAAAALLAGNAVS